jgi:5-oxopent-3-ene-1,2,5-tricarboxylate decarboxylase/2-hydroxyhepta-2,4-diene-1,7-dioate isomerase
MVGVHHHDGDGGSDFAERADENCGPIDNRTLETKDQSEAKTAGTIYGTLLNQRSAWAELGAAMAAPPYRSPPEAPILYLKPPNTWTRHGGRVAVPQSGVEIAPALGIVIARRSSRLSPAEAMSAVRGYVALMDIRVPHASLFRPALKELCRDGFCVIQPSIADADAVGDPERASMRVRINGEDAFSAPGDPIRGIATLLADVTAFMTLNEGDIIHLGVPAAPPIARPGDQVEIVIEGVGAVAAELVPDGAQGEPTS